VVIAGIGEDGVLFIREILLRSLAKGAIRLLTDKALVMKNCHNARKLR